MGTEIPVTPNLPPPTASGRRFLPAMLLAGIFLVAGILRFHHLETREPRISDEADYLMEAQWVSSLTHALLDSLALYQEERRSGKDLWKKEEQLSRIRDSLRGHAPYMARPGHILLIALAMEFLDNPFLAGAWVSALFGLLTVLPLSALARRLYGTPVALLASFFLAISACHVWYSRTGFAEADTTFFVVLTIYLYLVSTKRRTLPLFALTGLSAGLGFIVHHRFVLFLAAIWLFEVLRCVRERSRGRRAEDLLRFLVLNVCFALPIFAIEFLYHLAFIALQTLGESLPCPTYFSQLLLILGYIQVNNLIPYAHFFTWHNFLTYPYLFWIFEGPCFCVLLLGGIAMLAVRHRWPEGIIALLLLGPLAFYSYQNAEARFISGSLPFAMVSMALFVHSALAWAEKKGSAIFRTAWLLVLLVLAAQSGIAWSRIQEHDQLRADYRGAAEYLLSTGNPGNVSVYPHPFRLYLGEAHTAIPPGSEEGLKELYENGFRYAVVVEFLDYYLQRFNIPEIKTRFAGIRSLLDSRLVFERICERMEPAFEAPCDFCTSPLNILEINLNFRKSLAFMEKARQNTYDKIRVYDLGKVFRSENPEGR